MRLSWLLDLNKMSGLRSSSNPDLDFVEIGVGALPRSFLPIPGGHNLRKTIVWTLPDLNPHFCSTSRRPNNDSPELVDLSPLRRDPARVRARRHRQRGRLRHRRRIPSLLLPGFVHLDAGGRDPRLLHAGQGEEADKLL